MENKRLLELEKRYNSISEELKEIKENLEFDKLLVEYKKIKKQVWKINNDIKNSEDELKTKELSEELKVVENNRDEIINKFKKVEVVENKLYSVKKTLISVVASLDSRKNSVDYVIQSLKNKNIRNLEKIDKKTLDNLNLNLQKLLEENEKIQEEIKELKANRKPFNLLSYELSENKRKIAETKREIKLCQKVNEDSINKSISRNEEIIASKKVISNNFAIEIEYAVNLIDKIDKGLSFRDADEINSDSSFTVKHLNVFYGQKQALFDINIELPKNKVIAIIGPSGCGKSTFLRTLNRINDNIPNFKAKGKILLDGEYDIFKLRSIRNRYDKIELSTLRTKVGMIFQQPNPFPMSIAKNVQYGPKVKGIKNKAILNELTENSLKDAGIWEEVKDNLKSLGTSLSGGQQQRLCIARAIANEPEILLMDEPTSALDPIAAKKIEELILKLKENYTIIMVTHSMQQAQRISDYTAFFYQGELIEYGETKKIFAKPKQKETKDYITGKFG